MRITRSLLASLACAASMAVGGCGLDGASPPDASVPGPDFSYLGTGEAGVPDLRPRDATIPVDAPRDAAAPEDLTEAPTDLVATPDAPELAKCAHAVTSWQVGQASNLQLAAGQ